jgi:hypothetical protein
MKTIKNLKVMRLVTSVLGEGVHNSASDVKYWFGLLELTDSANAEKVNHGDL